MVSQAIHMVLLNPVCLGLILVGVIIGIIFGSIPGLSSSMALILFLPMSFGMEPMNGIALLVGLYMGGISGGLVSAILLRIPGTAAAIAKYYKEYNKAKTAEHILGELGRGEAIAAEVTLLTE